MSRTLHHVRWKHWNVKRPEYSFGWTPGSYVKINRHVYAFTPEAAWGLIEDEETVGIIMHDLRFYAGCRRTPQHVTIGRTEFSYVKTWGHSNGACRVLAKKYHAKVRNAERAYGRGVAKLHRASEEYGDILEPEGRTRHSAIWDAF